MLHSRGQGGEASRHGYMGASIGEQIPARVWRGLIQLKRPYRKGGGGFVV
jgi:hypothetical protein